eukprot:5300926-Amphidinium_carterae.1
MMEDSCNASCPKILQRAAENERPSHHQQCCAIRIFVVCHENCAFPYDVLMPRILENVCHWQSPPGDVPSSMTAAMMPPAIARSRARSSFGHFLSTPETDLEEDDKDWGPLVLSAHQDAGAGHHSNGEEHMSHVHRGGHSNANAVDAGRHDVPHPHPIKVRVIRIQR